MSEEIRVKVHSYGAGRALSLVYIDPVTGKKVAKSVKAYGTDRGRGNGLADCGATGRGTGKRTASRSGSRPPPRSLGKSSATVASPKSWRACRSQVKWLTPWPWITSAASLLLTVCAS